MVKFVTSVDDFAEELKAAGSKLVVVDFTASWCGPCRMIAPIYEQLATDNTDVVFLKVDVDDAQDVAEKYGISSMPTFLFFKNGSKVHEFSGADQEKLKATVTKLK